VLGEMADALILGGQRVVPHKATAEGYDFRFSQLAPALHEIYR
jgi:NAD dependent epimerase/dehydratase family enzyme